MQQSVSLILLRRAANNAGSVVFNYTTRKTRLQQKCHICNSFAESKLVQRLIDCHRLRIHFQIAVEDQIRIGNQVIVDQII